jgi:hypothetical protein
MNLETKVLRGIRLRGCSLLAAHFCFQAGSVKCSIRCSIFHLAVRGAVAVYGLTYESTFVSHVRESVNNYTRQYKQNVQYYV